MKNTFEIIFVKTRKPESTELPASNNQFVVFSKNKMQKYSKTLFREMQPQAYPIYCCLQRTNHRGSEKLKLNSILVLFI